MFLEKHASHETMMATAVQKKALSPELLKQLNELIPQEKGEHHNYQDLASLVQVLSGELHQVGYQHEQIPLDQVRYEWLRTRIASRAGVSSILEVGGNLGYLCLRLVQELGLRATCVEPIEDYVRISNLLAKGFGLEHLYQSRRAFVLWENIDALPQADVLINLNVIHHAGRVFDSDVVARLGGWAAYAQSYLQKLAHKGRYLFFQTGNTWPAQRLFENTEAPEFLAGILGHSGWRVIDVGIFDRLPELTLSSYPLSEMARIPRIWCQRNTATDLVDYYHEKRLLASFPTGLAQRPLFFCESTR
jgi:hypothetical protein